jgi:hypothetical protein
LSTKGALGVDRIRDPFSREGTAELADRVGAPMQCMRVPPGRGAGE